MTDVGPRYECTKDEVNEDNVDDDELTLYGKPVYEKVRGDDFSKNYNRSDIDDKHKRSKAIP